MLMMQIDQIIGIIQFVSIYKSHIFLKVLLKIFTVTKQNYP